MNADATAKSGTGELVIMFAAVVLAGIGLFFIPAFIIRPLRYQSPGTLRWAMAIRQVAPLWTIIAAAVSLGLTIILFQRVSKWLRALFVLGVVLVVVSAAMARLNYFEWMFHHLNTPRFEPAGSAKLDPSEMVMAVRVGNDSRAYPIREMAYHHVANDVVGGVPIAVTY
jgi:Protein of unknown function (DUF3179)